MNFTAYNEEQLKSVAPYKLTPGIYDFEVSTAKEKISKSGNEMIELTLRVYDKNGKSTQVFDYLLGSSPFGVYRIRNFCENTGLLDLYEKGEITDLDCVGKTGKVNLIIEKSHNTDYPDRLKVKEYLAANDNKNETVIIDDDLPF